MYLLMFAYYNRGGKFFLTLCAKNVLIFVLFFFFIHVPLIRKIYHLNNFITTSKNEIAYNCTMLKLPERRQRQF